VNISNGSSGIVKVHRNKIVGRIDSSLGEPSSPSFRQSPGRGEFREEGSPASQLSPSRGDVFPPQGESPPRSARLTERAGLCVSMSYSEYSAV